MKRLLTLLLACLTCLNLSIMAQNNGDVQDSVEYKRISFMPDDSDMLYMEYYSLCDSLGNIGWDDFIARYHPWVFSFDGDTLCIKGVYPLNCFSATAECIIQGTIVDVWFYQSTEGMDDLPDCEYDRLIDVRIPGFEPGLYNVGIVGGNHVTLECKGKDTNYYYYNGGEIPLTLNENKVVINIPKTYDEASERIRTNVQVLNTIADETFDIFVISRSDFEKLASLDFWEEDATSVILTSSYYTEDNDEVFATPYLNVKLKEEQDIEILNSYADEYGLRIVKNMPSMPLWYILHVTLDSKKNTLECANELYETGYFSASAPDFVAAPDNGSDPDRENYVPFVGEGKTWYCGYYHTWEVFPATLEDPEGEGIDCIFTMRGDTLIGDREYKRVFRQFEEYYGDAEQHYFCCVREEACQVFIIEEGTTEEKLIYDFSRPNEVIKLNFKGYPFTRTDGWRRYDFLPGQLEYKICDYVDDNAEEYNSLFRWIDGVGSPSYNPFAFEFSRLLFDQPDYGEGLSLRSCIMDGKQIFSATWMAVPCVPLAINDRTYIDNTKKSTYLYDLSGRRIVNPKRGLYIQGNKKIIR